MRWRARYYLGEDGAEDVDAFMKGHFADVHSEGDGSGHIVTYGPLQKQVMSTRSWPTYDEVQRGVESLLAKG